MDMLNIIVCVKVVIDPEAPASTFKIDPEGRRVVPGPGVPPVLNPYDENALEAALRIKDRQPGRITVISAGKSVPKAVIRKCLAVGADELVIIEDDIFESAASSTTASLLAAAVKKLARYDLIFTGRMASDTNAGQVGSGMAELLGIPGVTVARRIDVNGETARVERALADGYEAVEVPLPCLVTVSHELGEMRTADVKGLMAAQKQAITTLYAGDLAVDITSLRQSKPLKLFIPERQVQCDRVEGPTPEEAGANLALKLRQMNQI